MIAVADARRGQFLQPLRKRSLRMAPHAVALARSLKACGSARPPLADAVGFAEIARDLAANGGLHHCRRRTSWRTARSSVRSATNRLSLTFSSSSRFESRDLRNAHAGGLLLPPVRLRLVDAHLEADLFNRSVVLRLSQSKRDCSFVNRLRGIASFLLRSGRTENKLSSPGPLFRGTTNRLCSIDAGPAMLRHSSMTAGAVQHLLPCLRQFAMLHDKVPDGCAQHLSLHARKYRRFERQSDRRS